MLTRISIIPTNVISELRRIWRDFEEQRGMLHSWWNQWSVICRSNWNVIDTQLDGTYHLELHTHLERWWQWFQEPPEKRDLETAPGGSCKGWSRHKTRESYWGPSVVEQNQCSHQTLLSYWKRKLDKTPFKWWFDWFKCFKNPGSGNGENSCHCATLQRIWELCF